MNLLGFPKSLQAFKPFTVKDYEWYKHKLRISKSKLDDPLGVICQDKLRRLH